MVIRQRKLGKKRYFYLRASKRQGENIRQVEVYLGRTLTLGVEKWLSLVARFNVEFPKITIRDIFWTVDGYTRKHNFPEGVLAGLQEAMRVSANLSPAHRVLGLKAGANVEDIKCAYRQLARSHHPDAGGNRQRFEELVRARDLLLAKLTPTRAESYPHIPSADL